MKRPVEHANKKTEKSVLMRIWGVVSTVIVAAVVLLAAALVGVRFFGLRPYAIISGSMEPEYPVGSLVYVKPAEPEEVKEGDPIAFVLNEELVVAIHRVVSVDEQKSSFITKGDANEAVDAAPVHFNNLIGKPVFCIPMLGYVSDYITNPPGMYVAICAAVVLLVLMFLPDLLKKADNADKRVKKSE